MTNQSQRDSEGRLESTARTLTKFIILVAVLLAVLGIFLYY